ncbi:N-formylglutamate amidohydrolase [Sneathiella sp.]|jgi:N-formylglutamate amidohydrolase|uniref:N-formylglutamate amidohydrolase n=1 Tax=Sneathiella sp. TaxID=1964365 RepID=UPI0039E4866C
MPDGQPETSTFHVSTPESWTSPVIFSSPHSGRQYPDSFVDQSPLSFSDLRKSEDFLIDALFKAAPAKGSPLITATFPRAYCDVNRKAYELDPDMFLEPLPSYVTTFSPRISAGIGTIPKIVSDGLFIHPGPISFSEAQNRINTCYKPYHGALNSLMDQTLQKFGTAFLIDCHSMPSHPPIRLPDFVLGDRYGQSCPAWLRALVKQKLNSLGYTVAFNAPYAGGFITQKYAQPDRQIFSLQIEISRALYMEQDAIEPNEHFPVLQAQITDLIGDIIHGCLAEGPVSNSLHPNIQAAE